MPTISSQSTLVGVALIALGVLFLLPVVTGIELSIGKWWPLIIVLGGMFAFSRGAPWHGLTAIGIAAFLLLSNLDIVNVDIWQFWPVFYSSPGRPYSSVTRGARDPRKASRRRPATISI